MNKKSDVNQEMQQVSAYPTKQKMHQKHVALLDEQDGASSTQTEASDEQQQG
jgi:hypothetical protein